MIEWSYQRLATGTIYHLVTPTNLAWPRKVVGQSLCGAINLTHKTESPVTDVCVACRTLAKHAKV